MAVGMFMAVLDVQVVATSLPTIQTALAIAPAEVSWVQTAYLMAEVVSIPLTGLLTRMMTLRWLVVTALAFFTLASFGCATSQSLPALVAWRLLQGFAGGTLIPAVFTAVFLLFPLRQQPLATTLAGVLAVLAPTVGPIVGGYLTATLSWHWLFLINVGSGHRHRDPGRASSACRQGRNRFVAAARLALPRLHGLEPRHPGRGPQRGTLPRLVLALGRQRIRHRGRGGTRLRVADVDGRATGGGPAPPARPELRAGLPAQLRLRRRALRLRLPDARVPGLCAWPRPAGDRSHHAGDGNRAARRRTLAAALEARLDARLLTAAGFLVFTLGLGLSTDQTVATDYDAMLWPQILRGIGIMFCLIPTTRLALGLLPTVDVPDASGLFNLCRNLGGAIGLALIDTILYGRAPRIADGLEASLRAGSAEAARQIGIPVAMLARRGTALDPHTLELLRSLIAKAALTQAMAGAWAMLAAATCIVIAATAYARRTAGQQDLG